MTSSTDLDVAVWPFARPVRNRMVYDWLRLGLGLLLLIAASLKGYQLATEPSLQKGLLTSRWFLIVTVEGEVGLGLWLLSGLYRRLAWAAALICFSGFAAVTLYEALTGQASCGCFGKVEVNPWYTFALDLAVIAALVLFRPAKHPARVHRTAYRLTWGGILALVLAAAPVAMVVASRAAIGSSDETGITVGVGSIVLLEPEKWPGKGLPILKNIDVRDHLTKGSWTLVLYRHDCPHCMEEVPKYERWAREHAGDLDAPHVALIEMPPYGIPIVKPDPGDVVSLSPLRGRLDDTKEWFVQTPVVLSLRDGIVLADPASPPLANSER